MTIKKVKEKIGFHYLLIKIQLYTLIKCIAFIEYMVAGKDLLDYTYLFSLNNYTNNCNIIYKYFKAKYGKSRISSEKNRWNKDLSFRINKHNDLISENHKKTCKYLNYVEHLLILASTITGSHSVSPLTSLVVATSVDIESSAVGLKICAITAGIKKHKLIIKKKKKAW